MKRITLSFTNSKSQSYPIYIGAHILGQISGLIDLQKYTHALILTDTTIAPLFLKKLTSGLAISYSSLTISPGEQSKNIDSIQTIWTTLRKNQCDRKSIMINLGGGVIGDIGGFAASTYMRGIDFIQVPTSILAQVDASIGGKTGIDFDGIKNLIGTFNQPKSVIIDVQTLSTLPKRELIAGFAEIIKHGLIKDANYFAQVTSKKPQQYEQAELINIIAGSCQIKGHIVTSDEHEGNDRKLLNFGHTIGHAIEALSLTSTHPFLHGEAVSLGIVAEAYLSYRKKMLTLDEVELIKAALVHAGLPTKTAALNIKDLEDKMLSDKKTIGGTISYTLLRRIGKAVTDQKITNNDLESALAYISS